MSRTTLACFVLAAAIATPGIVVAATASGGAQVFQVSSGFTAIGYGTLHQVQPMSPAMQRIADALTSRFGAKGVHLLFLPTGEHTWEAFQSGTGRCLVDIVLSANSAAPEQALPSTCDSRSTVADGIGITYSPASARATVEQALATLR